MVEKQNFNQEQSKALPSTTASLILISKPANTEKIADASVYAPILMTALGRLQEIMKNGIKDNELDLDWLNSHSFNKIKDYPVYRNQPGQFSLCEDISKFSDEFQSHLYDVKLNEYLDVNLSADGSSGKAVLTLNGGHTIDLDLVRSNLLRQDYQLESDVIEVNKRCLEFLPIKKDGVEVGSISLSKIICFDPEHAGALIPPILSSLKEIPKTEKIEPESKPEALNPESGKNKFVNFLRRVNPLSDVF